MVILGYARCCRCSQEWRDYPGQHAKVRVSLFLGLAPEVCCPACHSLYFQWSPEPITNESRWEVTTPYMAGLYGDLSG